MSCFHQSTPEIISELCNTVIEKLWDHHCHRSLWECGSHTYVFFLWACSLTYIQILQHTPLLPLPQILSTHLFSFLLLNISHSPVVSPALLFSAPLTFNKVLPQVCLSSIILFLMLLFIYLLIHFSAWWCCLWVHNEDAVSNGQDF